MAVQDLDISIEKIGIADILARYQLAVPLNQRPYQWETDEVEKLLLDVTGAFDNQPMYFLGTVLFTRGDKGLEVADGQQRLATISMLVAAIRDKLISLGDLEGAQAYESDYLIKYDPPSGTYRPRLRLNTQDDEYFHNSILIPPAKRDPNIKGKYSSNERIRDAFARCVDHIDAITGIVPPKDQAAKLYDFLSFLKNSALVIVVTVPSKVGNSFKMFETLNARGVPASQVDILKNYLFDRAPTHAAEIAARWLAMVSTIEAFGNDALTIAYIRHLWVSQYGPTTIDELGRSIEDKIKNEAQARKMAVLLEEAATDYVALLTPLQSPRWSALSQEARQALNLVTGELGAEQIRPLMLAVARTFPPKEVEKATKLFLSWTVRFLIAGGGGGGKLDRYYGMRAQEVTSGQIKTAKQLASSMAGIVPNDAAFEEAFARASVTKTALARYYLRALELHRQKTPLPQLIINEDPNAVNLEHILPINPNPKEWTVDQDTAIAWHRRIGNMVLLGAKENSVLGNAGFGKKKQALHSSIFNTTKEAGVEKDWGPEQIRDRQKKLAASAPKVWPLTVK